MRRQWRRHRLELVRPCPARSRTPATPPEFGLVAILLTDDEAVADLNAEYRRKKGPTNVLSFPAAENPEGFLGDLALAQVPVRRAADP